MILILRGYLKKDNYIAGSTRKKHGEYDIDFLEYANFYQDLIKQLKLKSKVKLYFTSYESTPKKYLEKIKEDFKPEAIFLCSEEQSTQFTSVCNALHQHEITTAWHDELIMVLRSDILMTPKLINQICDFEYNRKNLLYVLSRDKNNEGKIGNLIDIFHAFYPLIMPEVRRWMCQDNKTAHHIEKDSAVEPIFDIMKNDWLDKKESLKEYLEDGLIRPLYSTWSGTENTFFMNEKYMDYKVRTMKKK